MKILFIGDYSNLHSTLARELRRRGNTVTVLSDRCGCMDIDSDIYLQRGNYPGAGVTYLYRLFSLLPRLSGYDVVQLINPHFFSLRPGKLRYFLRELRRANGSVFLSLAGDDHFFVRACLDRDTFRYSEFRIGYMPTEFSKMCPQHEHGYMLPSVQHYTEALYAAIDGAMSVLPEYDMAARPILGDKLAYTGLPIDLDELTATPLPDTDKVRILVGMRSQYVTSKGTDHLLRIAREAAEKKPGLIEVENVVDLPWTQYLDKIRSSHIVLDQLYSYSPAMNALDTMALGRVSGSGAQPEYYDMIGEKELRPIISLSPYEQDIAGTLYALAADRRRLEQMAADGRKLVERHNDTRLVTDRYERHWAKHLNRV